MKMNIEPYVVLCKAIITLLEPLAEIVIHDLETGTVQFIEGNLSQRKIGDPSLLDYDIEKMAQEINNISYCKLNFDGRLIKSVSVPIKEQEKIKALICINYDISLFNQMQKLSTQVLNTLHVQPTTLFKNDWKERMHINLHQEINKRGWKFVQLTGKQKKELIKDL